MVKYVKASADTKYVVVFFNDAGYSPAGSDGVYYSPYNSERSTVNAILSPDFVKHRRYPNFVVITYSQWDAMSGANYEKLFDYIDDAISSGNYYTQK